MSELVSQEERRFKPETHQYYISGRPVPSVTQVLADLLPGWKASEWFLRRGTAVHACSAMIAKGVPFEHDKRITGQVEACRRWFSEMEPDVLQVELPVYSKMYQFAGTLDLLANLQGKRCMVDFKATLTETVPLQCAAYAIAYEEMDGVAISYGAGVQLGADGRYKMTDIYNLKQYRREWLALLTAYRVRRRLKIEEPKEEESE